MIVDNTTVKDHGHISIYSYIFKMQRASLVAQLVKMNLSEERGETETKYKKPLKNLLQFILRGFLP